MGVNVIAAVIAGAGVGVLGRVLLRARVNTGIWLLIVAGVIAALVGTVVAWPLRIGSPRFIDWIGLIFQIAFAVVAVTVVSSVFSRPRE